jgi:predicted YcjX-like family ATPase
VEEEKDVGVIIHKSLKPSRQCERAANTAMGILAQIAKCFHYRDKNIFVKLYTQHVRPHLEFATPAWSPWLAADKQRLEKVQEKAVDFGYGPRKL